jgi:hypothetical protein
MLTFNTTDDYLIVGGKTVYIKAALKCLGGKWNKHSSCWSLPIFLDSTALREAMLGDAMSAYRLRQFLKRNIDSLS